jgi:hypothetical protein
VQKSHGLCSAAPHQTFLLDVPGLFVKAFIFPRLNIKGVRDFTSFRYNGIFQSLNKYEGVNDTKKDILMTQSKLVLTLTK